MNTSHKALIHSAILGGSHVYFGKACDHGHGSTDGVSRYKSSGRCVSCEAAKAMPKALEKLGGCFDRRAIDDHTLEKQCVDAEIWDE